MKLVSGNAQPNTAHSDLVHMMSDELPIFDEMCRRSLLFIQKSVFFSLLESCEVRC